MIDHQCSSLLPIQNVALLSLQRKGQATGQEMKEE